MKNKPLIINFLLILIVATLPFVSAYQISFGEVLSGGSDRFTFTGQELDGSGLMYYGARYYDPKIGKFTQPDTLLPDMYNPQALNRYSYVLNNPYKYTDPEGENPLIAIAGVLLVAYAVVKLSIYAYDLYATDKTQEERIDYLKNAAFEESVGVVIGGVAASTSGATSVVAGAASDAYDLGSAISPVLNDKKVTSKQYSSKDIQITPQQSSGDKSNKLFNIVDKESLMLLVAVFLNKILTI